MGSGIKCHLKFRLVFALVIWGFAFGSAPLYAQSYNEIFRQKKTQEKYLLKQVAYLKLYADQAWKGYKLVSGGLETINDFTSGEFKLHEAFFSGLSRVSGVVRKDYRVVEIAQLYRIIRSSFGALLKSAAFSPDPNWKYFKAVEEGVLRECNADLDELMTIVLSGDVEMNDAERLARLKKIHGAMAEKASFARWFCSEAKLLLQSQKLEKLDIQQVRRLYEKN